MERIFTTLSGHGQYGVRTIVPAGVFPQIITTIQGMREQFRPPLDRLQFNLRDHMINGIGLDGCFHLNAYSEKELKLDWKPDKLEECIRTQWLLRWAMSIIQGVPPATMPWLSETFALDIDMGITQNSCYVRADCGSRIWDVVESEHGGKLAEILSTQMKNW